MQNFNLYIPCELDHCFNRGLQKYYAVLDQKIELEGNWEVGLSEISFTKSTFNVKERQTVELIKPVMEKEKSENFKIEKIGKYIEPGEYTKEEIVYQMNEILAEYFSKKPDISPFPPPLEIGIGMMIIDKI